MESDITCPSCKSTRHVKDYRPYRTKHVCKECALEAHRVRSTCQQCKTEFVTKAGLVKRKGRGQFCSKDCYDGWQRRNRIDCVCEVCSVPFKITGYYRQAGRYCSMECRNVVSRRTKTEKSLEALKNGRLSISQYRALAFENYDARCAKCGYDRFVEVLEVDHIDGNNKNHIISNLQILCPTCHKEKTYAHRLRSRFNCVAA